MSEHCYWRPKNNEGKRLPPIVKEALRQHPAYVNSRPFWCALYVATDDNPAIKEIIDFLEDNNNQEIEVFQK